MRTFLLLALLGLLALPGSRGSPSLVLKGPAGPVLEGQSISLECLSDPESDMSGVYFQKYSRYMGSWYRLDQARHFRCWFFEVNVTRTEGRLQLHIPAVQSWTSGPYRCARDGSHANDTGPSASNSSSVSNSLSVPVHYMRELSIYRDSSFYSRFSGQLQELRVAVGGDVEVECSTSASETPQFSWSKEGDDWMELSSKLKLRRVREEDSGTYTCTAQHPSVSSLVKRRSLQILVVPEEELPWLQSAQGRLVLMTSVPAAGLLLLALGLSVCLYRRSKHRASKGPIDDHSQKKPIYRSSVESLPSTVGDTQPLV
ncbi:vascular endothelial growth factor receptor 3 [Lepisosteus oculatus]|uniref:vascular endothelial growth factor receptor 3 n=1 Tax=Lepisosteus oculatus TaxID=7918 RepID=UPI00073FB843|nr:PREDICTED: uncharacterized protein LOC102696350 [Lepisosteus oculatus]